VFNVGSWRLGIIVALATFVTAWAYCTIHYGFLFGFGLGWLPVGMLAAIVGAVSWLVSPFAAGLLLGSLLLAALWQDPELVWLPLALLAAAWEQSFWWHLATGPSRRRLIHTSGPRGTSVRYPLCPQKQTSVECSRMAALCQNRHSPAKASTGTGTHFGCFSRFLPDKYRKAEQS
jgi:hypothetical protein